MGLSVREVSALYASLTPAERDELLQCLLTAASQGGGAAVMEVLRESIMLAAGRELLTDIELSSREKTEL